MTIGTEIIEDAMEEIGVVSIAVPDEPDNLVKGMKKLNAMLELWLSRGVNIGFTPLEVPGDQLNELADTTSGIKYNLALEMSTLFDNRDVIVSDQLRRLARNTKREIFRLYKSNIIPDKVISSTTPQGEGNRADVDAPVFFPEGQTING